MGIESFGTGGQSPEQQPESCPYQCELDAYKAAKEELYKTHLTFMDNNLRNAWFEKSIDLILAEKAQETYPVVDDYYSALKAWKDTPKEELEKFFKTRYEDKSCEIMKIYEDKTYGWEAIIKKADSILNKWKS